MSKRYFIAEARTNLPTIVDQDESGQEIELTRRGKPVAILISPRQLERLRSERPRFRAAYKAFLAEHSLMEINLENGFFKSARERNSGRKASIGRKWPEDPQEAHAWLRQNGYSQNTQVTVSTDGLHFKAQPAITDDPYLRVFEYNGEFFGIVRLGRLVHSSDLLKKFEAGPSPFRDTAYNNQVRHVALFKDGDMLHIFLSVIGAAPEKIVHTAMSLKGDWKQWKVGAFDDVLNPEARYECPDWPVRPSEVGEIYGAARQLRDPAVYVESGKITLFYTVCGEQGIAAADIKLK